jgi:hypothetical protein
MDADLAALRSDYDDLGFDPFAETQKAFAEILSAVSFLQCG